MGDMAEGLLDGTFDSEDGEYLGEPCGYPRSRFNNKYSYSQEKGLRIKDIKVGKQYKYKGMTVTVIKRIRGNPRNISVLNDPCARSQRRFRLDTGDIVFAKQLFL